MSRYRVELATMTDCNNFVEAVSNCNGKIVLESGDGFRVNARSLIGALAATEWDNLYCVSENDIYAYIHKWVVS